MRTMTTATATKKCRKRMPSPAPWPWRKPKKSSVWPTSSGPSGRSRTGGDVRPTARGRTVRSILGPEYATASSRTSTGATRSTRSPWWCPPRALAVRPVPRPRPTKRPKSGRGASIPCSRPMTRSGATDGAGRRWDGTPTPPPGKSWSGSPPRRRRRSPKRTSARPRRPGSRACRWRCSTPSTAAGLWRPVAWMGSTSRAAVAAGSTTSTRSCGRRWTSWALPTATVRVGPP
mmetsp:Transcript_4509/g.12704  ORF Transcript_4509/g.12704 Transcript_4509/m.12704 type:complete len:232 (-) Transcript_4509:2715-3410(-)